MIKKVSHDEKGYKANPLDKSADIIKDCGEIYNTFDRIHCNCLFDVHSYDWVGWVGRTCF